MTTLASETVGPSMPFKVTHSRRLVQHLLAHEYRWRTGKGDQLLRLLPRAQGPSRRLHQYGRRRQLTRLSG